MRVWSCLYNATATPGTCSFHIDAACSRSHDCLVSLYSPQVMDHFERPRNAGVLDDPDGEATKSNPVCGDRMRVMIRVDGDRIVEVRWETRGCPPAIATSSYASE